MPLTPSGSTSTSSCASGRATPTATASTSASISASPGCRSSRGCRTFPWALYRCARRSLRSATPHSLSSIGRRVEQIVRHPRHSLPSSRIRSRACTSRTPATRSEPTQQQQTGHGPQAVQLNEDIFSTQYAAGSIGRSVNHLLHYIIQRCLLEAGTPTQPTAVFRARRWDM